MHSRSRVQMPLDVQPPAARPHTGPCTEAALGATAAAGACILTNPIEVVRVRLQVDARAMHDLPSPLAIARDIARNEGMQSLFTRGIAPSMAYNAVFNSGRFFIFTHLTAPESEVPPYAAGLCAGGLAGFMANPFARARTLLHQASPRELRSSRSWRGMMHEALIGRPLAGAPSFALRNGGHTACIFSVQGEIRTRLQASAPAAPTPLVHMAAALQAALLSCIVMNPVDLVSTRLQAQQHARLQANVGSGAVTLPPAYSGALDCVVKTVRADGVGGLYRGLGVNAVRIVPHMTALFTLMELLRAGLAMTQGAWSDAGNARSAAAVGPAVPERRPAAPRRWSSADSAALAVCHTPGTVGQGHC